MENQVYNWLVKKGNVLIQRNGDCIALQLDYEQGTSCLLTRTDTDQIIEILISISKQIWESPDYQRSAYTSRLFSINGNEYCWEIEGSALLLKYNDIEEAIEIRCKGASRLNLELNYVVEIIQILEHLNE